MNPDTNQQPANAHRVHRPDDGHADRSVRCGAVWCLAGGIFTLALLVRIAYLIDSADYPAFDIPIIDAYSYDVAARQLATGGGMSDQYFWQPFFYPFFLAGVYVFSGGSILAAKIVQVIVGAGTCALTVLLGERVFGRPAGIIAGLITAFYGPLIFYDAELLAAGWASLCSVAVILLMLIARDKRNAWIALAFGGVAGLSVLTRPTFLPFLAISSIWLAWGLLAANRLLRNRIVNCAAVLGGFLAVTIPVAYQNQAVTGKFGFLPCSGGINFYIGNHPEPCKVERTLGLDWVAVTRMPLRAGAKDPWEGQRYFYDQTIEYAREDPAGLVRRLFRKAMQFINSRELPRSADVYVMREWSLLQRLLTWKIGGFGFPFGLLLPIALVGIVGNWRRTPLPLNLFVILYPAAIIIVFVTARYRLPVIPILAVFAAGGVLTIVRMIQSGRWQKLSIVAAACVAVMLIGSLRVSECDDVSNMKALTYRNVGLWNMEHGSTDAAMTYCQQALDIDPDLAAAHADLGQMLIDLKRPVEALTHFEAARNLKPHVPEMHMNYGHALRQIGRLDDAAQAYRDAIDIDPEFVDAYVGLSSVLLQLGKLAEAADASRAAIAREPENYTAQLSLGLTLGRAGNMADAIPPLREAVRLGPSEADARFLLAAALENTGQREEAIREYRNVLKLQPGHALAHQRLTVLDRP